jgi:arylsulfatase A-like enzyme
MKNLILLTIDSLRRDALGCYGSDAGLSPFIDSLSDRSVRFTRAQATGPYTQASFPGILASSYYLDHPDHGKGKTLSPQRTLVSEVLHEAGIVTAAFHSNAFLCDVFGWNRGWQVFFDGMEIDITDETPYVKGDGINREVDHWLSGPWRALKERRTFLWVHYMDIHEPYVPAREFVDAVDPSLGLDGSQMFRLFTDVLLKRDVSDPAAVELLRKLYSAHVHECDGFVRDLFAILQRHGFLDDGAAIITSDHGDEFGEHGGLSHDGKMVPELLNVPLLVHRSDSRGPEDCDKLVSNVDIPPTIARLFDLEPPDAFQGRSLLPVEAYPVKGCYGEAIGKRGRETPSDKPVRYYCEDRWRVVHDEGRDAWELYDVEADPRELCDVAGKSPATEDMKARLQQYRGRENRRGSHAGTEQNR